MKYLVHGLSVSQQEAYKAWARSTTYRKANPKTRHRIWKEAIKPGGGEFGERLHLVEAGILIVEDAPAQEGS